MSSTLTTLALLLATTILQTRSCTTGDCHNECDAYLYATKMTAPTDITIEAKLSDLTNDNSDFKHISSNLKLEQKNITRQEEEKACYFRTNPTKGCTQNLVVDDEAVSLQCPWTYYNCDYDQNRIPQYLWRADCDSATSETVYYPVPVLKCDNCNPLSQFELVIEKVPVACACKV